MWICKKLLLVCLLSACAVSLETGHADLRVGGETVRVVAPAGFCVDPQSGDVNKAGGFVLFSDCRLLEADITSAEPVNAVISAIVSTQGLPGSLDDLEEFLTTEPGIVTLGRSGKTDAIKVLSSKQSDEILFIKVQDTGVQKNKGAPTRFWRTFFVTKGRLVTGTLSGFSEGAVSDAQAQGYLRALATQTRAANAT